MAELSDPLQARPNANLEERERERERQTVHLRAFLCAAFIFHSPALADDTTDLIAKLQLTMQRHVDQSLIGGAIQRRDLETGEIIRYYPIDTHSMVLVMGEDYVL